MKDVARAAGVSQPTVSRFLSGEQDNFSLTEETKNRILKAIEKLGYVRNEAARELKGQRKSQRLMFCSMFESPLVFYDIQQRIQSLQEMSRFSFFFHHIDENRLLKDPTYFINLGLGTYRTCILMGTSIQGDAWFEKNLSRFPIPILVIGRVLKGYHAISIDYGKQMTATLEYLWERGCRRILYLGRRWNSQVDVARLKAYDQFSKNRNHSPLIVNHGDFDEHGGYMQTHEALAHDMKPDSIVTLNDAQAIGAIRALHDTGLSVPQDVRVVGYGNFPIGRYTLPSVTTVPQFTNEVLDAVCGYILGVILSGDAPPKPYQKVFVSPEIIRRESG